MMRAAHRERQHPRARIKRSRGPQHAPGDHHQGKLQRKCFVLDPDHDQYE